MKKLLACVLPGVMVFVSITGFVSCSDKDDVPVTIHKLWFVADAGNYVYDFTDETNCRTGYLQDNGKVYPMGSGHFMFDRFSETSGSITIGITALFYRNLTTRSVEFYQKTGGSERILGTGVSGGVYVWERQEE